MRLRDFATMVRPQFSWDWYHLLLFDLLEKCANGDPEVPNLLISLMPGSGKTEVIMIIFAAWLIALDPQKANIVALSNADNLARMACSNVLRILENPEVEERFPLEFDKRTESSFTVSGNNGRPSMLAAGIMSQVTGSRASKALLFDDLVKNLEVAYSQEQLEKIWQNFLAVAETRLLPGVPIIGIGTRWSLADVHGRLLDRAMTSPLSRQFVYVNIAAWNTGEDSYILDTRTGEKKFLPKYRAQAKVPGQPYSFTRLQLESKRADIGPNLWSALYMGNPIATDSQLFPPEAWTYYDGINTDELDLVVSAWDFASKTGSKNDFSANVVLGRSQRGKILVLDLFKTKVSFDQLPGLVLARWQSVAMQYKTIPCLVCEDASAGTQVIQLFQSSQPHVPLVVAKAVKSKVIRAEGVTPLTRGGVVSLPSRAPWLESFIANLASFPVGPQGSDDEVDALVHGLKAFLSGGDFKATKFLVAPGRQQTEEDIINAAVQEIADNREVSFGSIDPILDSIDRGEW